MFPNVRFAGEFSTRYTIQGIYETASSNTVSACLMRVTSRDIRHRAISPAHSRRYLILIAGALLLIAFIDHASGNLPFQHLYYLPIILAATRFGRRGGLIAGLASVALYHLANLRLMHFSHSEGDIVQMVLFFSVGVIAAKLTDDANRMRLPAVTDDLTGLHNLRSFETHFARLVNQGRINKTPLSLLVLDLDRLKSLNDNFGHLAGAEAVRTVGHLIARHIPPDVVACRYGGDEFVIELPQHTIGQAVELAETVRRAVYDAEPTLVGCAFPASTLSISIGAAGSLNCGTNGVAEVGEELFRAADRALYRAKEQGRNQVCVMEADTAEPRARQE
jgi:diguanylate cyclase (GGDEF)-like protein